MMMMKPITKTMVAGAVALGVLGYTATTLADTAEFERALASAYNALAQAEREQGDRRDAHTYGQRAAAAEQGSPTAPDQIEARRPFLDDTHEAELSQARARLVTALDGTGRSDAPADAAHAQASFDCWLEQAAEDVQPAHIDACRDAFMMAMERVEAAAQEEEVVTTEPAPPPPAPEPEETYPENFLVFFDFDRAEVTAEGMSIVENARTAARAEDFERIVVTGHADRAGSESYNMALSKRRADAVKAALARGGIEERAIETEARGETQPLVQTADGVREPQNRRVEILIER